MANRCPDCNVFVSVELEVDVCDYSADGNDLNCEVTLNLNCANCGTTIKTIDVSGCTPDVHCESCSAETTDDLEVSDIDAEPIDGNDKYGRYYGADITYHVGCSCGNKFEVQERVTAYASEFEEAY